MAKKAARAKAATPVTLFRILADVNRYRAIGLLADARRGLLVSDLAQALKMGHSATSHLLSALYQADAVEYRKEGRTVRYSMGKTAAAKLLVRLVRIK